MFAGRSKLEGCKGSMKDIQTHLDKIRSDAAECVLLGNLVTDGKREVFARTAQHLYALALEVEKTIAANSADKGTRGESEHMARAGDREEAVATDIAAADHQQTARPRRMLPWLLAVVLGGIVGHSFGRITRPRSIGLHIPCSQNTTSRRHHRTKQNRL